MAGYTSGGAQNHGFYACSFNTIKQPKFLSADGGWNRIVWLPKTIKVDLTSSIPEELYDKIATEEDAIDPATLKEWLKGKRHPIVEKYWRNGEPVPIALPGPGDMWPGDEGYTPVMEDVAAAENEEEEKGGVVVL